MFSILTKIFGTANDRIIKRLRREVQHINSLEADISKLNDQELKNKTTEFKERLNKGETLDDIEYEAFAVVREAAKRTLKQRHHDVQLIGGLILHRGMISEMRTGEGKTLVSTLPLYLNALTGKGAHLVTVNDYLAKRDSQWMGKIFTFLGLSVGCVTGNLPDSERKAAYQCDITYATNNEMGFDYLRDNMKFTEDSKVQRPFNFAVIDEVDSILIDEARTPLIISGPVDVSTDLHSKINKLVSKLTSSDFEKDEKIRSISLTEEGINKLEILLAQNALIAENTSMYDFENLSLVHYINQSLKAHHIFAKDVDYLVQEKKVMIIDEFTGRVMDGRRYSDGLHQAIEAKENVPIQNENQTLASITFQNYFRLYPKLSGMTGTAMTEATELKDIYNLDVVSVPTHNKITRIDHDDIIYGTKSEKYSALIELIKDCYQKGQPTLVGTISIEKSEEISKALTKAKINHNVLNAKMHEKEAHIIAQAGRYGAVTIATNMAGRGTDIMLGGNPEMLIEELAPTLSEDQRKTEIDKILKQVQEEKDKVQQAGGLYVIGTERHESRRIDNQLRGRSGRQGDPGQTKFFLSLEDDLMRIFASDRISGILRTLGLKNGEAIHHPMISRSLEKAQQKVEAHNFEIRKNLLKFDDVMNDQRKIVYEQRNEIISSDDVSDFVTSMSQDLSSELVAKHIKPNSLREDWKIEELSSEIHQTLALEIKPEELANIEGTEIEISELLNHKVTTLFEQKKTDYGQDLMKSATKYLLLTTLDQVWKEHLHGLDYLRQGISLRAYGQKDPLNEYKREAFGLFEAMLDRLRELFIQRICYLHIDTQHTNQQSLALANKQLQEMHATRNDPAFERYNSGSAIEAKAQPFKAFVEPEKRDPTDPNSWGKISRNESCPCGSGKKFKHCHGTEES
ncbi:MAG: preprotein translocase subunit SecA [Rickettsiales bacterium]|nr:preprotein translocase subunit SecA [Rickettsiales bacterium]MCA0254662.1 preprotein translocase subunit SecA [Pseudomonadota bacterium]